MHKGMFVFQCIGATGVVLQGAPHLVVVQYKGLKKKWAINPEALTKKVIDCSHTDFNLWNEWVMLN